MNAKRYLDRALTFAGCFCIFGIANWALAQTQYKPSVDPDIPAELHARIPEIRILLDDAQIQTEDGEFAKAAQEEEEALELAKSKGFKPDLALAETALAGSYFRDGKFPAAMALLHSALEMAAESSNFILEADILVSLSLEKQSTGNLPDAILTLNQALEIAEKSKNPYIRSHVLGQLGWDQFLLGKIEDAKQSLEQALEIDEVNHYRTQAIHLVNFSYVLLKRNQLDQAEKALTQARSIAVSHSNISPLFFAERAEALLHGLRNEPQIALAMLEQLRDGKLEDTPGLAATPDHIHALLATPLIHAITLEDLAGAYNIVGRREEATMTWKALYDYSKTLEMTITEAEAALRSAELLGKSGHSDEALSFYTSAIDLFAKLQNSSQLMQALTSKSVLLIRMGRGPETLSLETQVATIANQRHLPETEFTAYMVLAETYQNDKQDGKALEALHKAAALIQDGSDNFKLDRKLVLECYTRMAIAYGVMGDPIYQLIALERAVRVAREMKDSQQEKKLTQILGSEIDSIKLRELAQRSFEQGRIAESLTDAEILFVFDGSPSTPSSDPNWNRILGLPFTLSKQPDGARDLENILQTMGPMLGFARLPIMSALADYYQNNSLNLEIADKYEQQAEAILDSMDESTFTLGLKSYAVCSRAWILSRQGHRDQAMEKLTRCMTLSEETSDKQSKDRANAINALVHTALNDIGGAEASIRYFLESHSKDPSFHAQLAMALAANQHYKEAVKEFRAEIALAEQQNNLDSVAAIYLQMATALNSSSNSADSETVLWALSSAREIYHKQGKQSAEGKTALFIGFYYQKQKNYEKAHQFADLAAEMATTAQDIELAGRASWLNGDLSKELGKNADALAFHEKALETFQQMHNKSTEISLLLAKAEDQNALHDLNGAISTCQMAQNSVDASTPALTRLMVQRNMGYLYLQNGEIEKALAFFNQERNIAKDSNDQRNLGYAELSISEAFQLLGRWDDALEAANNGLRAFKEIQDASGQSLAKAALINIYGDRTSSVQNFDIALSLYKEQEQSGTEADSRLDILEVYLQKELYRQATPIAKSAISDCSQRHDPNCQAHALITLGEIQRGAGDLKESQVTLTHAENLVEQSTNFYLHSRLLYAEANLKRAQNADREASALYEKIISRLEGVKGQANINDQRVLSETYGFVYDELIATLYSLYGRSRDLGIATESFKYAEENRARQFAQSWGRTFIESMRRNLPPAIQQQEQDLSLRQDRLNVLSLRKEDKQTLATAARPEVSDDSLKKLETDQVAFVSQLRTASPQYAAVAYPGPVDLDNLPLHDEETLVEFKMTKNATFVWIVRKERQQKNKLVAFYTVNRSRDWFQQRIIPLRNALNQAQLGNMDWSPAEELFHAIFPPPHAAELLTSSSIVFVPDDLLFILPMELLSPHATEGIFPLVGIATRYYPSAGSLNLERSAIRSNSWTSAFLGVGDPITSPNDQRYLLTQIASYPTSSSTLSPDHPQKTDHTSTKQLNRIRSRGFSFERLPGTAAEIEGIAEIFKSDKQTAEARLGLDATKARILDTDLSRYRYLHFATHGVLPTDTAIDEPALVLSLAGANPEEMFLQMSEILRLSIKSDMVVLSACNTGMGNVSRAEGVMSLGRAFLAAGASSVTVSLWQVSDESTVLFMEEFYHHLLAGESKDKALASARSTLFKGKYKDPFYWAPFILIGE